MLKTCMKQPKMLHNFHHWQGLWIYRNPSFFTSWVNMQGEKRHWKRSLKGQKAERTGSLQCCCAQGPWVWFPVLPFKQHIRDIIKAASILSYIKTGVGAIRHFLERVVSKALSWLSFRFGTHWEKLNVTVLKGEWHTISASCWDWVYEFLSFLNSP